MFEILSYVLWVVLALTLLVFVHEMGHFLAAKLFGMRVDRFSIGFPPVIAGKQWGDTEYVIGATPLGGYVKIAGMIDESMDTEHVGQEPEPHEFRAKPVWQRIIVITAGVVFNVILAALIFIGLKMGYGDIHLPAEKIESVHVQEGSVAYELGLRTGDRIAAINGEAPREARQLTLGSPEDFLADTLTITVERDGRERTFTAPPDIMTRSTRAIRAGEGLGVSYLPSLVLSVVEEGPADEAGLRAGDRITAVDGEPVQFRRQVTDRIVASEGKPLFIRWTRPDSARADSAAGNASAGNASAGDSSAPAMASREAPSERFDAPGGMQDSVRQSWMTTLDSIHRDPAMQALRERLDSGSGRSAGDFAASVAPRYDSTRGRYLLGVGLPTPFSMSTAMGERRTYGLGAAVVAGVGETWNTTTNIVESFRRILFGRDSFRANVGGPVEIARIAKQTADAGMAAFWRFVAFLSVTLAIMNILPIPALDGGHLMFLLYEGITRRRPSEKVRMAMQQIGFVVLIVFMAFVIFNDILRL